jgi:3-methyladenine DNA glycosylase/8-oxoguanine DNA glycosylase
LPVSRKQPSPAALRALRQADPALALAMRRVPRFPGFPNPNGTRLHDSSFHALARSIIYQQLAGAAARTIHERVRALTPGPRFPKPDELLALSDAELRGAGLSQAKMLALRDLARRAADGSLPLARFARMDDEAIVERLVEVRGIGRWTAQMFLIFQLGRLDVLAPDDLGLREGMRRLDGLSERPTPKELDARGEAWKPLRSVASWVLWRLSDEERRLKDRARPRAGAARRSRS